MRRDSFSASMRVTIWFVLLFAVAVVAATTSARTTAWSRFYWGGWRLDVSLNLFLLVLIGTCFLIVTVIQALTRWSACRGARASGASRGATAARQAALRDALAQYFGGRYSRAQKSAQRALAIQAETPELAQDNEFTVLGHLLAAGSAHRLQDRALRDEELRQRAGDRRAQRRGALGRGGRAPARRRMGARRPRRAARAASCSPSCRSGVARRTHALRLKLQAARLGRQPQEALKTGAPAGQAPGLLERGRGRPAALAGVRVARHGARPRPAAPSLERLRRRRSARSVRRRARRDPGDGARRRRRCAGLAAPVLGPHRRSRRRGARRRCRSAGAGGARHRRRMAAAARGGLRRRCRATAASRWRSGCALAERGSGARRAPCSSSAADDAMLGVAPRRKAWLALAELATREGDDAARRPVLRGRRAPGWQRHSAAIMRGCAAVAQLDRVLGYEPRGRGFDSCQPHQNLGSDQRPGVASSRAFFFAADFGHRRPSGLALHCSRREDGASRIRT